jgi:plasmid replication initiation protein
MNKEVSLKKHSAVIQISCKELTIIQRKLINAIIWIIQKTKNESIYEISLSEIKKMCGIQATDNVNLKFLFKGLRDIKLEFNYLNKDKHQIWAGGSFLSWVEIDKETNHIKFEMPEMLKEKIRFPSMYAPLNMILIAGFKCSYAIILYELLRDYLNAQKIPLISIADYRVLMGIKDHEYKEFRNFRNYVIIPAVEELNEKSDLTCRYELIKKPFSNKYESIRFLVTKKTGNLTYEKKPELQTEKPDVSGDLFEQLETSGPPTSHIPEEVLKEIPEKYRVKSLLDEIIKKLDEGKAVSYIRLNLRYALKKAKENPLFYAINALKNNYAGFDVEVEEKKDLEKKTRVQAAQVNTNKRKNDEQTLDMIRSLSPEQYGPLYEEAKQINAKENPGNPFFIRDSMIELKMAQLYTESQEKNGYQNKDGD